jgi:hypothetical protein
MAKREARERETKARETKEREAATDETSLERAHARFGWTALFAALAFGTAIEALHGVKASSYLLEPMRREMWTLAHFHAATLAIVNLVYAAWATRPGAPARLASRMMIAGSVLLPVGFFLGGIAPYEGDPGVGVFLAPVGAVLVLAAVGLQALSSWRG